MKQSVFVGGASLSGKSTLAKMIAQECGLEHVQIDSDPLIKRLRPYFNRFKVYKFVRWRAIQIINQRKLGTVAEVGFFTPKYLMKKLRSNRRQIVLYVGCPTIDLDEKIAFLVAGGFKNTIKIRNLDDAGRKKWLQTLQDRSITHQRQCKELGIPFFDMSDVNAMTQTQEQAALWVKEQLAQMG